MARKPQHPSEDSSDLHAAITQIMEEMGRGGLTFVAAEIGMTPSALRKRLLRPESAFDGPTLRAVILVMELKKAAARPPAQAADTQAQESGSHSPDHQ